MGASVAAITVAFLTASCDLAFGCSPRSGWPLPGSFEAFFEERPDA